MKCPRWAYDRLPVGRSLRHLVSYTNNNPLFLMSLFQILICNERLVLFPFFFYPLKKVCFQTEILSNLFKYIYFHMVLFFCLLLHRLAVRIWVCRFIFFYMFNCTDHDPGLQLGDPAPLIGLLLWTCRHLDSLKLTTLQFLMVTFTTRLYSIYFHWSRPRTVLNMYLNFHYECLTKLQVSEYTEK